MNLSAALRPVALRVPRFRLSGCCVWLLDTLVGERSRWVLWFPVCLGVGIGIYFSVSSEPWPPTAPLLVLFSALLLYGGRRRPEIIVAAFIFGSVALGAAIAQWHAIHVAAPVLERAIRSTVVVGTVEDIAATENGYRLTLAVSSLDRLPAEKMPHRIRLRVSNVPDTLRPGDTIRVRARLSPPPEPAMPGAYDFQRRAWFSGLGAVGFATGRLVRVGATDEGGKDGIATWLEQSIAALRFAIQRRITDAMEGAPRALALAMITGERSRIPEYVAQAMRDSGLAHLLAISGLHLGLVAGFVFLVMRGGLALAAPIALRMPIKKWAAAAAIVAAFAYLLLAGAPVPTQRAFVMTGFVLLAVIVDRIGISMRLVGWAAVIVLVLHPEALTGASFQMSFAAVIALVAAYEVIGNRLRPLAGQAGPVLRLSLYFAGIAVTSLVAGLATAPFALFHFDRLALYGLIANMISVPVAALWVMPWAVGGLVLMPFGLEAFALTPMGWGLDAIVAVAETVASWPGAVQRIPQMPLAGLLLVTVGGLWLTIWQRRWRLAGVPLLVAGLTTVSLASPPDILVSGDGRLAGLRVDSSLYVSSGRTHPFARDLWRHRVGAERWMTFDDATVSIEPDDATMRCDPLGCIATLHGRIIAFVRDPRALVEDCRVADIVVATVPVRGSCSRPKVVIDRFDLWRAGAHAIWINAEGEENGLRVRSANQSRGDRPWVLQRARSERQY